VAETTQKKGISRRLLLGGAAAVAALGWAGTSLARLGKAPSGRKDLGRIADIDGMPLPHPALSDPPPFDPKLTWLSQGGDLNDASALSRTPVYGVVAVKEEADIAEALAFAKANNLKISMAAVRHSMGGHAFDDNALVLDMMQFNKVSVDEATMTMTVQPGATWHDIQNMLHPKFAVKAMQSTDIFSVGGSISVNAHGMDHQSGSVAGSIRGLRVMLADGAILACSRDSNADLFRHVVGGYGLFGVILSADLEIVPNVVYETTRDVIKSEEFPAFFTEKLEKEPNIGLFYGHLSTAPGNFLQDMIVYRYDKVADAVPPDMPALGAPGAVEVKRIIMNLAKKGGPFQELKWFTEKTLEPVRELHSAAHGGDGAGRGVSGLAQRPDARFRALSIQRPAGRDRHPA
jgi:hypothetical protein